MPNVYILNQKPRSGVQHVVPVSTTVLNFTLTLFGILIIVIPSSHKCWIILRTFVYILLAISSAIMNTWTATIRANMRKSFLYLHTALKKILFGNLDDFLSFPMFVPFLWAEAL